MNLLDTTKLLLKLTNVLVTETTVEKIIKSNSNFPSILALSQALLIWNVKSMTVKISKEQLSYIPLPSVSSFKEKENGCYVILRKVDDNHVFYTDSPSGELIKERKEEFVDRWSNLCLLLETNKYSGEIDFEKKRATKYKEKIFQIIIVLAFSLLSIYLCVSYSHFRYCFIFLIKILGVFLSFTLINKEIGISSPLIDKVCYWNKKTSCDKVLKTPLSNIFSWKLSEIGLMYFVGGLFVFSFAFINRVIPPINTLSFLYIVVLPISAYIIYYQWRILKKWCVLCTITHGLIWLEFIIVVLAQKRESLYSAHQVLLVLVSFILPILFWSYLRSKVFNSNITNDLIQLNWFKNNISNFKSILANQKPILEKNIGTTVVYGNKKAKNTLVIGLSFTCPACYNIFKNLLAFEFLFQNTKIELKFSPFKDIYLVKYFLHLLENEGEKKTKEEIHVYLNSDKKSFIKERILPNIGTNNDLVKESSFLKEHLNWFNENEISFTPSFVFNGRLIPNVYSFDDLKILLKKYE